ncbi:MFS transporter [Streptomyces odonnellii]|uniref:MFS transporter n=1 Tax=Streptomyces odonnellii TaxID=1417980 RepID=UPI0006250EB8|nr:MFS transporter [Streptomyces odonnellii]
MRERYVLRSYVIGAAAARTGDEMSGPALLLAGLAITGSASTATLLLAGVTVSAAVGGPVFGVLLDRSPRPGRLLAVALGAYASALVLILLSIGRVPVVATLLIAVCAGLLGPALSGGWTGQLPHTVGEKDLSRATSLDAMTFNAAGLTGPAAAGAVAGTAGAPASVIVSATLIGVAVPTAWRLPVPSPAPVPKPVLPPESAPSPALPLRRPLALRPPARTPLTADIRAGFRAIVRTPPLARATAVSVISCVGQGMFVACSPLLGERVFGAAGHGVLLLSGVAASALLANALLARCPRLMRRPDTVLRCATLVLAVALLLAAAGRPVPLIVAAVIAGLGEGPQLAALFAVRHREAPERLRAQIFTTGASLKITAFALGATLTAPLAARSLPAALLTAAAIQAFAALSYGSPIRRKSPGQR